jgi:hypothetical protein
MHALLYSCWIFTLMWAIPLLILRILLSIERFIFKDRSKPLPPAQDDSPIARAHKEIKDAWEKEREKLKLAGY